MRPSEITAASALQLMAFFPFACAVPSFGDKLFPRQGSSSGSGGVSGAAAATGAATGASAVASGQPGVASSSTTSNAPTGQAGDSATPTAVVTTAAVPSSSSSSSTPTTGPPTATTTPGLIPGSAVVCGEVASYSPSYNSSNPATPAQAQAFSVGQITVLLDQQNTRWQGFFPSGDGSPSVVAVEFQGQAQTVSAPGSGSVATQFPYTGPPGMRFAVSDTLLEGVTNAISNKCATKGAKGSYFIPLGQPVQNATSQPVIRFTWSKNVGSSVAN